MLEKLPTPLYCTDGPTGSFCGRVNNTLTAQAINIEAEHPGNFKHHHTSLTNDPSIKANVTNQDLQAAYRRLLELGTLSIVDGHAKPRSGLHGTIMGMLRF